MPVYCLNPLTPAIIIVVNNKHLLCHVHIYLIIQNYSLKLPADDFRTVKYSDTKNWQILVAFQRLYNNYNYIKCYAILNDA